MKRHPGRSLVALGVVGLALALTACSSGDSEPTGIAAPISTTTTTTRKPLSPEQVQGLLTAGVYRASDLPGWTEKPFGSDKSLEVDTITDMGAEEGCRKLAETIFSTTDIQKANSNVFENGEQIVQNSITVFGDPKQADKLISVLNKVDPKDCLDKAFEHSFSRQLDKIAPDTTLSNLRTRKVSVSPLGDNRASFEVSLDVKPKTGPIRSIRFTRLAVEVGPAVIDFSLRDNNQSFPNVAEVTKPVVQRVEACENDVAACAA